MATKINRTQFPEPLVVFEHERVPVRKDTGFTEEHYNALLRFNDQNGHRYLNAGPDSVTFSQFVGVIKVGDITIEILPKAGKVKYGKKEKVQWQKALPEMLRLSGSFPVSASTLATLQLRHQSLLDLYLQLFLNETAQLIRQGLVKRYRREEGNLKALKGSLIFSQQIAHNLVHKERFYTRHQIYDYNHRLNQLLSLALQVIEQETLKPALSIQARQLLLEFPPVDYVHLKEQFFNELRYDRKTERYRPAVELARLILLQYNPQLHVGQKSIMAILFDMNDLYEAYIFRRLNAARKVGMRVRQKSRKKFWENKELEPDVVIEYGTSTYILDTKWKLPDHNKPAPQDLRQIYAYNHLWGASKGALLYPGSKNQGPNIKGAYRRENYFMKENNPQPHYCLLLYNSLLNEQGELDKEIGAKILRQLLEQ